MRSAMPSGRPAGCARMRLLAGPLRPLHRGEPIDSTSSSSVHPTRRADRGRGVPRRAGSVGLSGSGRAHRRRIRTASADELGLACSVGVAPVKFLAKLASEAAKPTATLRGSRARPRGGRGRAGRGDAASSTRCRSRSLWGVGPATASRLRRLGVATVGDSPRVPAEVLEPRRPGQRGPARPAGAWRGRAGRSSPTGRSNRSATRRPTRSTSDDHAELDGEIVRMAGAVATRMRRAGVSGGRSR